MSPFDFVPGQRWISNSESELGLGLIQSLDHRTITIDFPASNEVRTYAIEQAPLSRVSFAVGDSIKNQIHEKFNVTALKEKNGIITYAVTNAEGVSSELCETELSAAIKLNRPQDRLFTAQFDPEKAYILRHDTLNKKHLLSTSLVNGLYGARMSLIPHQLYIAHEVAQRPSPRVLLADEVGLGKTIEAGLILHHQLISGRAQRILIVVPDALLHQWLVEMLRRFNLKFSLFNEERCRSLDEDNGINSEEDRDVLDQKSNPFQSEQLILCSLDFLMQNPNRHQQVIDGEWDTLIIDEAHHLKWEVDNISPEYQLMDILAQNTPSVLLLTATPEQLGPSSHFARLRLLDPHRFHNLDIFLAEESHYTKLAETAECLIDDKPLEKHDIHVLKEFIPHDDQHFLSQLTSLSGDALSNIKQKIVDLLIDQHGTGRVLFRNTRHAIKGFPERNVNGYALDACEAYSSLFEKIFTSEDKKDQFSRDFNRRYAELMLTPETVYQSLKDLGISILQNAPHWTNFDPRVSWIINLLKELKNKKVLVICAHADTALELEDLLKNKHAIRASVFHENMSIIERDRAAAYFADEDEGAQVLICSEIGSEGRNFQFSHNLVLFDLPLNSDLLEQRIGRLDRIGQKEIIQLHIPYIKESAQEILFHWYKEGLDAFAHTCPAGQGMVAQLGEELQSQLEQPYNVENIISLLDKAKPLFSELNLELQKGRDRLLEMNSFRKPVAEKLVRAIHEIEDNNDLEDYMMRVCDTFGVEQTDHSAHSYALHPGNHMLTPHFPELPEDGVTVTFDRETALVHEDRLFMSWEHPMVTGAMDMVFEGEHGNVAFSIIKNNEFKTGTVLLEMLFVVQCIAPAHLQIDRFMPAQLIRLFMDKDNIDYSDKITFEQCKSLIPSIDAHTCQQIVAGHRENLRQIISHAESQLSHNIPVIIDIAEKEIKEQLGEQISRLISLQKTNPNVRDDEIQQLTDEKNQLNEYIQHPQLRLDALRLIIAG